ncbi:MAG TPA: tetraacyldisaccharide 4'-kinase, partial [Rheinheimera sp.]|uniref:tetraacyldisaccharide 4'-kinase n=1 Tax=Rheinheimera sp. TaxID=1869214 RepID=UPI002F95DE4E
KPVKGADGVMHLKAGPARSLTTQSTLDGTDVTLVAGIGNPQRFERTAVAAGFNITARHYFADHHKFTAADFAAIDGPVLMTEKDAVKCHRFAKADWFSLSVDAEPDAELKTKLTLLLTELRSKYGT